MKSPSPKARWSPVLLSLTLRVWSWLPVTSRPAAAFSAVIGFWWAQDTVWVSWHMMMSLLLNTGEDGMLLLLGAPVARQAGKSLLQQIQPYAPRLISPRNGAVSGTPRHWTSRWSSDEPTLSTLADTDRSYSCSVLTNNWSEGLWQGPQQQNSLPTQ